MKIVFIAIGALAGAVAFYFLIADQKIEHLCSAQN